MNPQRPDLSDAGLYDACWANARDALLAVECRTGRVVDANSSAMALVGRDREALSDLGIFGMFQSQEHQRLAEILQKGTENTSSMGDFLLLRRDGSVLPVMLSSLSTVGPGGEAVLLCVLREKYELERQNHLLATLHWALSAYTGAARALVRAESSQRLFQQVCEAITKESCYLLAWVGIAEESEEKAVRVVAVAGTAIGYLDGLKFSWDEGCMHGQGPTGRAIRSGQIQWMKDCETEEIFRPWCERASQYRIRSSLTVPLLVEGICRGALMVYASCADAFESVSIDVFEDLAREIGHGLQALRQRDQLELERRDRTLTQEKLTEAFSSIVSALVTAVEARDPYTAGHEGRVAEIACAIGQEMGWSEERLTALRMAAMVHDIGKISVPIRILVKPGMLSERERKLLNAHPDTGYAILRDIPFDYPVAEIMRQHHEKLDGSGYPRGLRDKEILPESRVLTVSDIVEAMACNRPYRKAIPLPEVIQEIERQAGHQLDAEVVRVCVRLLQEKRDVLPQAIFNRQEQA